MLEVYTDGASSGDPGLSGAGVYIKQANKSYEYFFHIGQLSNHEAEFIAVIKALEICKELFPGEILSFRSDSKTVVDVIERGFTKNAVFAPFLNKILEETRLFPYFFIKWVPSKQNKKADTLAKQGIRAVK